jgi:hypothetical protein
LLEKRQHWIRGSVITFLNYIISGALTLIIPFYYLTAT